MALKQPTLRRPRPIGIVGWLLLLYGLLNAALFGAALARLLDTNLAPHLAWLPVVFPSAARFGLYGGAGLLTLSLAMVISGIGVLRLQSWAGLLAMITQGINLATLLVEYLRGRPWYLEMAASVAIVFLLNQRAVRQSFRIAQHRRAPTSLRTAEADRAAAAEAQAALQREG
jgi:uncharacterized membrane protein (UPF0136 family)